MVGKRRNRRIEKKQTVGVIVGAISAIASLVVATLFIGGQLSLETFGLGSEGSQRYRNITLTDAQIICEEKAREEYKQRLKTLTADYHSSRYDDKSNRFKMFFKLDMYPKRGDDNIAVNHFLNCFVHGSRGYITHFESVEDKEEGPKPIRESEGNVFGF